MQNFARHGPPFAPTVHLSRAVVENLVDCVEGEYFFFIYNYIYGFEDLEKLGNSKH